MTVTLLLIPNDHDTDVAAANGRCAAAADITATDFARMTLL